VFARSEFGDDASVFAVDIDLGGDDAGENGAAVEDDGGSGLVARGFDAEDFDGGSVDGGVGRHWRIRD
jgi:hypothetical protein